MHKDNGTRRDFSASWMRGPIGRSCASFLKFLPAVDRRPAREQSVQSAQSMQPVISWRLDPLGAKASIPLAGKCRREGCVSKRHFAASGVARRFGSGDVIERDGEGVREGERGERG